jgi:hypothetical protein
MEEEGRAVVDPDGNLLVFGPLRDPHRHETRIGCSLKELIREIAVPRAEESEFLRFMAGILPARDANNRKLWERGDVSALAGLLWYQSRDQCGSAVTNLLYSNVVTRPRRRFVTAFWVRCFGRCGQAARVVCPWESAFLLVPFHAAKRQHCKPHCSLAWDRIVCQFCQRNLKSRLDDLELAARS